MQEQLTNIYFRDLTLRSWWLDSCNECESISMVLPEVFAINNWIMGFSKKLAKENLPVIALPLDSRTSPELDLL